LWLQGCLNTTIGYVAGGGYSFSPDEPAVLENITHIIDDAVRVCICACVLSVLFYYRACASTASWSFNIIFIGNGVSLGQGVAAWW
jgi:hypothetical protein